MRSTSLVITALLVASCASDGGDEPLPDTTLVDRGCSKLFYQDRLPEYHVTIAKAEWDALTHEFLDRADREAAGLDPTPYHPIELEFEGERVPGTMIRLKGQSSWWETIAFDEDPKMQFVIAFNEVDPDGRFMGVRKVELDMPRTDESFLRQRLALYYLRKAGQTAQCANNAKLFINGEYYGLYTNLERLDKEFLQRVFGEDDDGDLWKGGRFIKTNEETFSWERLDAFWHPTGLAEIESLVDLDASVKEWATEAMIPHGDGYYNGRANFFLYDHPQRGFIWIPHDLDAAYDYLPAETSPQYPECEGRSPNDRDHWALVLSEPRWLEVFRTGVATARASYAVGELEALVSHWAEQISTAAAEDPMKPFSNALHEAAINRLHDYPRMRADVTDAWLSCWRNGGDDADGDGFDFCNDCDDQDPARHPGAREECNGYDDDCDGQTDETPQGGICE